MTFLHCKLKNRHISAVLYMHVLEEVAVQLILYYLEDSTYSIYYTSIYCYTSIYTIRLLNKKDEFTVTDY